MAQSWSGIRKRLEQDLLSESLRGRVRYFITKYTKAHDEEARMAIVVDGKEVIKANVFDFYKAMNPVYDQLKIEHNVEKRVVSYENGFEILNDNENNEIEDLAEKRLVNEGVFAVYSITDALDIYLHQSIDKSLQSDNPVVRMFAVLDRRVGKRTLDKLKGEIDKQPEWLQFFYKLRIDA